MSSALDKIIAYKRDEVVALKQTCPQAELQRQADAQPAPLDFINALCAVADQNDNALICELKRKSPSAGEILPGANPVDIARHYVSGGAACLSVLTDGPSFGGHADDFRAIRQAVRIPMLRKDFMIDPVQVIEARAMGADAVLIILSAIEDGLARALIETATDLGMASLIETHDRAELERALSLPSELIGINNRDLKRMQTDLATTERLAGLVPDDRYLVSESGICEPEDISRLRRLGIRRFLIGESLMKHPDRMQQTVRLRQAR